MHGADISGEQTTVKCIKELRLKGQLGKESDLLIQ